MLKLQIRRGGPDEHAQECPADAAAADQWGQPNGYILGEEAGGAFVGGLRYGDGTLYTKDAGDLRVFWQGPTIGVDLGADGARTMMLVYNLPRTNAIYQQFNGIAGAAYFMLA